MSGRSCEITPVPHNCLYAKVRVTEVKHGPKRRSLLPSIHIQWIFFFHSATAVVGQGLLIIEASRPHPDTPQSVRTLRTGDQPDTQTSTRQHTTLTRENHATGEIRTRNPSKRAALDSGLRPRGPFSSTPTSFSQRSSVCLEAVDITSQAKSAAKSWLCSDLHDITVLPTSIKGGKLVQKLPDTRKSLYKKFQNNLSRLQLQFII